jgi:hypothetical protein
VRTWTIRFFPDCPRLTLKAKKRFKWHVWHGHELIKYIDTKAKCRHLNNWPVKGLCGRCFSKFIDWRYCTESHVGIFDPAWPSFPFSLAKIPISLEMRFIKYTNVGRSWPLYIYVKQCWSQITVFYVRFLIFGRLKRKFERKGQLIWTLSLRKLE